MWDISWFFRTFRAIARRGFATPDILWCKFDCTPKCGSDYKSEPSCTENPKEPKWDTDEHGLKGLNLRNLRPVIGLQLLKTLMGNDSNRKCF